MDNAYVGIDVSKATLDCFVLREDSSGKHRKFGNSPAGFRALADWVGGQADLSRCKFCMESTGGYSLGVASFLAVAGWWVTVQNPRRVKHYAIAANFKTKTDKVDSRCLAHFVQAIAVAPWAQKDPVQRELCNLRGRLSQLAKNLQAERGRLEDPSLEEFFKEQILEHCVFIQGQARQVEGRIRQTMAQLPQAAKVYHAVTGIKGVGPETGLLMATLDILSFDDAQSVGTFFGLNPVLHQSGKYCGQTRISKQGDSQARALLSSAAVPACRSNEVFKALYDRLLAKGMPKKRARTAVARKLAMVAWAVARNALTGLPITYPGGEYRGRANKLFAPAP